jgi:UDPglucose 6-dehydrogenase/GDP-mannose 6-dehydrogenase
MKVTVVGTGYVGLVSGVCFAAKGHDVCCVDVNPEIVRSLNDGEPHIYERGLTNLLHEVLATRRFKADRSLEAALAETDIAIIAVGTPSVDGVIDLSYVRSAARGIGAWLRHTDKFLPVIVKSTVIPGTTDTIVKEEIEAASGKRVGQFGLGMNPEFLREGDAVEDFMAPDRIVLGYEDERTLACLDELYAPWDCDKLRVSTRTAELIKYANNALLATQISAVNEIANLAAAIGGIDVMDVVAGVHLDKRWNPILNGARVSPEVLSYLVPGCGFGGSCFPKDVQALRAQGRQLGLPMGVLDAVLTVNARQPDQVVTMLERHLGDLASMTCLVLGLAFKPGTDDVRESPALKIVDGLNRRGANIIAHDPIASANFKVACGPLASAVTFTEDWCSRVAEAQAILVVTRWDEYQGLAELDLKGKVVFDARRMFCRTQFPASTSYLAIGLQSPSIGDRLRER